MCALLLTRGAGVDAQAPLHAKPGTKQQPSHNKVYNPAADMSFMKEQVQLHGAKSDEEWEGRVKGFLDINAKKKMLVLLDHGEANFHGEVFYSVANRVKELMPEHDLTFVVDSSCTFPGVG